MSWSNRSKFTCQYIYILLSSYSWSNGHAYFKTKVETNTGNLQNNLHCMKTNQICNFPLFRIFSYCNWITIAQKYIGIHSKFWKNREQNKLSHVVLDIGSSLKFCFLLGKFKRINELLFPMKSTEVFLWFPGEWKLVNLLKFTYY